VLGNLIYGASTWAMALVVIAIIVGLLDTSGEGASPGVRRAVANARLLGFAAAPRAARLLTLAKREGDIGLREARPEIIRTSLTPRSAQKISRPDDEKLQVRARAEWYLID
jgi:hypothetical protein